jgi:hypothetical protein
LFVRVLLSRVPVETTGTIAPPNERCHLDFDYRPHNYFWAAELKVSLPSSIAGETRRQMVRALVERDAPIPDRLDAAILDAAMREAWGGLHPSHMGGEFLTPLRKGEVEIARIALESVTADQISIRARRIGQRIGYRVVDEYPEFWTYVCHPASSVSPLTLGALIALIETARERGSIIFPILAMNRRDSTLADLATFITVTSDSYPDLGTFYRAATDGWLERRARKSAES